MRASVFPCNVTNFLMVLIQGIGTWGNLHHWEENKLHSNSLEIGSRLVIALSGSGTQYMPGNLLIHIFFHDLISCYHVVIVWWLYQLTAS